MAGQLGYFTLPVADLAKGRAFYRGLFGWQLAAGEHYAHIENTTPPGGLVQGPGDTAQVWFRVDDIGAAVARVRELGGVASPPSESPSGWSADCRDDQGTRFSLWQPAPGYA
ncbi:MAG: VOC family protein [Deltaproteobacteria bacterium]|nr:VOC family protein [Deltaproteobacteria bacterium]